MTCSGRPSIEDAPYNGSSSPTFDNKNAFNAADGSDNPVYVPAGNFRTSVIPAGLYYGPATITIISSGEVLPLAATPQRVNTDVDILNIRRLNFKAGQLAGQSWTQEAAANTASGHLSQSSSTKGNRCTTSGWASLRDAVNPQLVDAYGASSFQSSTYADRVLGLGSNTGKWAGCDDPIEQGHDYFRPTWPLQEERECIWPDWMQEVTEDGEIGGDPKSGTLPTSNDDNYLNLFAGRDAGIHLVKGKGNSFYGGHCGEGWNNTGCSLFGWNSGARLLLQNYVCYFGADCATYKMTGDSDTFFGASIAPRLVHGINLDASGFEALYSLTGGESKDRLTVEERVNNISAHGSRILHSLIQGTKLAFDGPRGGFSLTTATNTVGVGYSTYDGVTEVTNGTAIGHRAGIGNANGLVNTLNVGSESGGLTQDNTASIGQGLDKVKVSGRLFSKRIVTTINNVDGVTYNMVNSAQAIILRQGNPLSNFTDSTPTAASIVANIPQCEEYSSYEFQVYNNTGKKLTLGMGAGCAAVGTMTVLSVAKRRFVAVVTNTTAGSETATIFDQGSIT